ncbi:DUF6934 family protein [Dyadobacter psychrotolerans]|uniref:Uncharacterized protein n=1 Tax=Dyadobacter psychrotolerans TaxID=2541721 RepID=A0A4R5DZ20_9BACT|nr:hypothetical protein [Dyadobacter psychrotolerans]TDE16453.1 hypothetical protein E0F88_09455 [Dyadobacter psychrotolerans]
MNEDSYEFTLSRTEYRYEFVSVSAKKEVRNIVLFSQTSSANTYNLALLDLLNTGELSDMTETNNDDFVIVMATVFKIVNDFFDELPGSNVVFGGSDDRRQRLYKIIIGRELEEITKTFDVFGILGNTIEKFESNKIYELYLIKKR